MIFGWAQLGVQYFLFDSIATHRLACGDTGFSGTGGIRSLRGSFLE
jgi:hypothetical protein